jgi:hypothetical protein
VDERWLVPHFEKMLCDNALLIELMTEVWRETQSPLLKTRIAETVDWISREMTVEGGGFASSYDADSDGEEGKFYVWSAGEIMRILGTGEDAALFAQVYDVTEGGNWEGKTILNRLDSLADMSRGDETLLAAARAKLFEERAKRSKPGWDDKVLADWNGLAIRAIAKAADIFQKPDWLRMAENAYIFICSRLADGERLCHSYRAGRRKAPATATDYANMTAAALQLHQITNERRYLDDALGWTSIMDRHYAAEGGGYYLAADDTRDLIIRPFSARDDAVPNANPVMMQNLVDLFLLTGEQAYWQKADKVLDAFQTAAQAMAIAYTGLLSSTISLIAPNHIVVAGEKHDALARDWQRALAQTSMPDAVTQWVVDGQALPSTLPAHGKGQVNGVITAYICIGQRCSLPETEPESFHQTLVRERTVAVSNNNVMA